MVAMARQTDLPDFDALWDYNDPAATEAKFREILPAAESSGDADYHAELLTQIARTQGLQRRFEEAHRTLDEAEPLIGPKMARARIRALLERGRVFNSSRQVEQARPLFMQAWELACEKHEDGFAVDAAHMIAIVEQGEAALEWNLKALALAEGSDQPRAKRWLGSLYNNIGWTYHDMRQYQKALEIFNKAVEWRQEQEGQEEEVWIAEWCVARALRSLGRIDEALAIQWSLLARYEEIEEQSGFVYEELAECLHRLKKTDEAREYFALAYGILSQDAWLAESEPERIARLKQMGEGGA